MGASAKRGSRPPPVCAAIRAITVSTLADVAKTHSVAPAGNTGARIRVAEEPKDDISAACLEVALAVVLSKALFRFLEELEITV
jgi:hypothetical protein